MSHRTKDCYLHGNDCIIMQLIVSSHANCVIESLLLKKDCPKGMSKDGIVCLLMILNVNTYANVILERSLRTNEGHIGVNESIMTVMKHIWTQMNVYFP